MIAGQFLDVSVQARGRADVDAAMTVLRYKSAKYSIERPLHIGAALAGASASTMRALTEYGLPLGEAFQLRDDLLGVFGDPATTGKPAGDDLVEGKRTVLVALALDGASPADAALLDRSLGTDLSPDDVAELRRIIDTSGAAAQVEAVIDELGDPRRPVPRAGRPRRTRHRGAPRAGVVGDAASCVSLRFGHQPQISGAFSAVGDQSSLPVTPDYSEIACARRLTSEPRFSRSASIGRPG